MNLSRAAKKFRTLEPKPAPKQPTSRKKTPEPVVEKPVEQPAQVAEQPAKAEPVAPQPKKEWPVKPKRARFVRERAERRERVNLPPLASSQKFFARLMTQNLAVPPKDEVKLGR